MKRLFQYTRSKRGHWAIALSTLPLILILGNAFAPLLVRPVLEAAFHTDWLNANCTLIVPEHPLSDAGLATPYLLTATNSKNGPCHETNREEAVFIQGAVFDPATGKISVYNPLVINQGAQPAEPPVVPRLPKGGIVALWFGSNGMHTRL